VSSKVILHHRCLKKRKKTPFELNFAGFSSLSLIISTYSSSAFFSYLEALLLLHAFCRLLNCSVLFTFPVLPFTGVVFCSRTEHGVLFTNRARDAVHGTEHGVLFTERSTGCCSRTEHMLLSCQSTSDDSVPFNRQN
jgi:hypothetical protein